MLTPKYKSANEQTDYLMVGNALVTPPLRMSMGGADCLSSGLPNDLSVYWHQYPYSLGIVFCKLRALISEAVGEPYFGTNGSARPVLYHCLTEIRREITKELSFAVGKSSNDFSRPGAPSVVVYWLFEARAERYAPYAPVWFWSRGELRPFFTSRALGDSEKSKKATYVSVLTISAFSLERYLAICHPLHLYTMAGLTRASRIILVLWIISIVCASPFAVYSEISYRDYPPTTPVV
ncbi:unnamed protein product [Spodoptera exigua]|nr:unnamed protein product [Spodoptera exigua]